ncbi:Actin- protein 6 [Gaertneriomyces sp. JEL0708]|nr:Actin- protein 6 [Gaertneriomyces sp. JEL0708]
MTRRTLVIDNGAYCTKAGYADDVTSLRVARNSIAKSKVTKRTFIGDELSDCTEFSGLMLRTPFERGYLTTWETQRTLWQRLLSKDVLNCDPTEHTLLLTEPCFNLPNIQQQYDEIIFEEFSFAAYNRSCAPFLCSFAGPPASSECTLVVDSGYSFTHIVPICNGQVIWKAVRRIDVGGKLLTNQLKELISFRQWNMMDEVYLVNHIKELCCYVTERFDEELEICKRYPNNNDIRVEYVLPDQTGHSHGFIRAKDARPVEDEQVLIMNSERFTIPEILFHPSDIGITQAGIAEAVIEAVEATQRSYHALFYSNIMLVGGNACLKGIRERLERELRVLAPSDYEIRILDVPDPASCAWYGGAAWASQPNFGGTCVSREEYLEHGTNICAARFQAD